MISRRQLPELRAYAAAETSLPFALAPEFRTLVVPNGNDARPVHRWFRYKEAFSADLLDYTLKHIDLGLPEGSSFSLLDPFCGVGTSLVSAQLLQREGASIRATGIDCNPFSAFVAQVKTSWPRIDAGRFRALAAKVLSDSSSAMRVSLPALSSVKSGRCISHHSTRHILTLRDRIRALSPSVERDALLVGLAACIEPVSKVRRDGRALRLVEKRRTVLSTLLAERWELMASDLEAAAKPGLCPVECSVRIGDGRRPGSSGVELGSVDLILTSPPYPNNIDYNEVYKLELWLLGFVDTEQAFLGLRRDTYRSHPTCSPPDDEVEYKETFTRMLAEGPIRDLLGIVIRRADALDRLKARGRSKVLLGYLYDTWRSLIAHRSVLRPGACAVYVVGNSLHGGADRPYLVPTDLVLARLAQLAGFRVERLLLARPLQRRLSGNHFLRDSIVVLRRD